MKVWWIVCIATVNRSVYAVQISFADGEDILLLSNSNPHIWKVRNGKGEEAEVPSVIVLIPGPSKEALDSATKYALIYDLIDTYKDQELSYWQSYCDTITVSRM